MTFALAASLLVMAIASLAQGQSSPVPAGIEKLHQDDIAATVARDADALTALWDDDAVLLQPGAPPVVGKVAFRDFLKGAFAQSPSAKVVKYVPDVRDVQVAGNVAYEWGYFEVTQKLADGQTPTTFQAKLLRVMKRQSDGSWKFTRVMWLPN